MARKNYSEDEVLRSLSKKNSININRVSKTLTVNTTGDLGNGSWGKIDFLTNYCGYHTIKAEKK